MLVLNPDRGFIPVPSIDFSDAIPLLYSELDPLDQMPCYDYQRSDDINYPLFALQTDCLIAHFKKACTTVFGESRQAAELIEHLERFADEFLSNDPAESHFVGQSNSFFEEIKRMLEVIMVQLNQPYVIHNKRCFLSAFLTNLTVCGPGTFKHIFKAFTRLTSQESLIYWLAEMRTSVVDLYAEHHIERNAIPAGNSIHAHITYEKLAWQQGLQLLGVDKLVAVTDKNFERSAKVTEKDKVNFYSFFIEQYSNNSSAIIYCVEQHLYTFLNECHQALASVDKPQWIVANSDNFNAVNDKLTALFENIGLTQHISAESCYQLNDDSSYFQLKPSLKVNLVNLSFYALKRFNVLNDAGSQAARLNDTLCLRQCSDGLRDYQWLTSNDSDDDSFVESATNTYHFITDFLANYAQNDTVNGQTFQAANGSAYRALLPKLSASTISDYLAIYNRLPPGVSVEFWLSRCHTLAQWQRLVKAITSRPALSVHCHSELLQRQLGYCFTESVTQATNEDFTLIQRYLHQTSLNYLSQSHTIYGTSVAFLLLQNKKICQTLSLADCQPLVYSLTAATLNQVIEQGPNSGQSLLSLLCETSTGLNLLSQNEFALTKKISIEALSRRAKSGQFESLSPAFLLCRKRDGINLLTLNHYHLTRLISERDLLYVATRTEYRGLSMALMLASNPTGLGCLRSHNDRLLKLIPAKTLNEATTHPRNKGQSILSRLASFQAGRQLLCENNYQLASLIQPQTLNRPLNNSQPGRHTLADILAQSDLGKSILQHNHLHLAKSVSLTERSSFKLRQFLQEVLPINQRANQPEVANRRPRPAYFLLAPYPPPEHARQRNEPPADRAYKGMRRLP